MMKLGIFNNKTKNTVIFLDIDGVLNTKSSWKTPFQLDNTCIKNFCESITNLKTPVKIILTSSWKNGFSSVPEYESPQLKNLRQKLQTFNITISGRTKNLSNRMNEIDEYLKTHDVSTFAVIDDDKNEYSSEYLKKVTLIDSNKGFLPQN